MINRLIWFIALMGSGLLTAGNLVLLLVAAVLFKTLDNEYAGQGFGAILNVWSEYVAWPLVLICASALVLKFLSRLVKGHTNWFIALLALAALLVGTQWYSANLVSNATAVRSEIRDNEDKNQWAGESSGGTYSPETTTESDHLASLRETFKHLHTSSTRAFLVLTVISLVISLLSSVNIIFGRQKSDELEMLQGGDSSGKNKRDGTALS